MKRSSNTRISLIFFLLFFIFLGPFLALCYGMSSEDPLDPESGRTCNAARLEEYEPPQTSESQIPQPILIVDDCPVQTRCLLRLLPQIFSVSQYPIQTANNGLEALELIRSVSFVLVFMDNEMPEMAGIEVIGIVRERDQEVPIIGMSSDDRAETQQGFLTAGANTFIPKPIRKDRLRIAIELVLKRHKNKSL